MAKRRPSTDNGQTARDSCPGSGRSAISHPISDRPCAARPRNRRRPGQPHYRRNLKVAGEAGSGSVALFRQRQQCKHRVGISSSAQLCAELLVAETAAKSRQAHANATRHPAPEKSAHKPDRPAHHPPHHNPQASPTVRKPQPACRSPSPCNVESQCRHQSPSAQTLTLDQTVVDGSRIEQIIFCGNSRKARQQVGFARANHIRSNSSLDEPCRNSNHILFNCDRLEPGKQTPNV